MDIQLVLSFLIAAILLTLMPGPDNILVLTESISKGKRNGIALSMGLCSGVFIHTLLAATGLSILLLNSDIAFRVLKYFGAAYLLYLAFQTIREENHVLQFEENHRSTKFDFWKLYKRGFLMNVLNPKVSLFFIAFLPQFVTKSGLNYTIQMIVFGILFITQAFLIFVLIANLSGKLNTYVKHATFWIIMKYVQVTILIILAVFLLIADN